MARLKQASYRAGVAWIAENDEPGDRDPETVAELISTMLLADLFGAEPERVATDIIRYRAKHNIAAAVYGAA
jgi:hypothetical protein